jgi:hypothetical protein
MRRLTYANVMATIAVVVAVGGGGYAVAQSGGSQGTIKGCTHKKSGALRVLKAGKKCKRIERAIAWNIEGPAGQAGSDGPAGTGGAAGPQGAGGAAGQTGSAGATGPAGADGANGTNGTNGVDGAQGPTGPEGPTGSQGATGPQGPTGAKGATGAQGPTGARGATGPTGPQGSPDTAPQILNKLVTVDGNGSGLDADFLDGLNSTSYGRKVASSTIFVQYSAEAYDDPGECVNQFFTNIGGLELGDQVVASITRDGSELSPPLGLLGSAWIVERVEGGVEVPRILVRFCNVTPGVIESVPLAIRATVYR